MPASLAGLRVSQFIPFEFRSEPGQTTVILNIHPGCDVCRDFRQSLRSIEEEFAVWEARLLVLEADLAGLLVADRYGHIFHAVSTGYGHAFPAPRTLAEWLKFLGTLCPE